MNGTKKEKNIENIQNTLKNFVNNYEFAKEHLCLRTLSSERYEDLCDMTNDKVIGKPKETFYLVPYLLLDDSSEEMASCAVTTDLIEGWGITKEELMKDTLDNSPKLFPFEITTMEEKLGAPRPEKPRIYVISNKKMINGASALFYRNAMSIAYLLIGEEYYVLPSSVHELLAVPVSQCDDAEGLAYNVRAINAAIVSKDDYLSDNVFKYDASINDIVTVA
jgi:hypothetical protein